jgi:uncharacterized protein YbjT (DUF2867 family)
MMVSQMALTSSEQSSQQQWHWLAEQMMDWSGLPVVHVRPTVFIDNPLFTFLNAASVRERHTMALPFGSGRTEPVTPTPVARIVALILGSDVDHQHHVYELTRPAVLDIAGLAERYSRALRFPVSGVDVPYERKEMAP